MSEDPPGDVRLVEGDWRAGGETRLRVVRDRLRLDRWTTPPRGIHRGARNIMISQHVLRTDIGERWTREGDLLQTWGYRREWPRPPIIITRKTSLTSRDR